MEYGQAHRNTQQQSPNATIKQHLDFAHETQGRFLYFRQLSEMIGEESSNHALEIAFMQEMSKAVETLGGLLRQIPLQATRDTKDGGVKRIEICGVGADTESGFIFLVRGSVQEQPEQIAMQEIRSFEFAPTAFSYYL